MQNILYLAKKYIKDIVLFLLVIICIGFSIYNIYFNEEESNDMISEIAINNLEKVEDILNTEETRTINIDIKGAVKKPGVYQVNDGTIINDVVSLAGGFNSNAYQNGINLSKKVSDEMVIFVYTKAEIKALEDENKPVESVTTNTDTCKTSDYSICECVSEKESIIETNNSNASNETNNNTNDNKASESNSNTAEVKLVNINTATETELTSLSGIGASKAEAIISYRNLNGKFTNITDIMNVSGIGEALFAKIKSFITI